MAASIGIVGGGAIGVLFGYALTGVADVKLLVRSSATAGRLAQRGIRVAPHESRRVAVTTDPHELAGVNWLLLAVKTYDSVAALTPLRGVIPEDVPIVSIQNGLGNELRVAAVFGEERTVVLAPTSEAATPLELGEVVRVGSGTTIVGTAAGGDAGADAAERFASLLRAAGLDSRSEISIDPHVWAKAIANAGINPVGAIFDLNNAGVAENAQARAVASALVREAVEVARASGVALPFNDPVAHMLAIARATGANHSSMWHDVRAGRRTEIDALNGAIATRGARLGIPTPENRRITDEVKVRLAAYGTKHA